MKPSEWAWAVVCIILVCLVWWSLPDTEAAKAAVEQQESQLKALLPEPPTFPK